MKLNIYHNDKEFDIFYNDNKNIAIEKYNYLLNQEKMNGWLNPNVVICEQINKIEFQFNTLVVVGVGGSFLGAKALVNLFENENKNVIFIGNDLSTRKTQKILRTLENIDFHTVVISKNGTTLETMIAFRFVKELSFRKYGNYNNITTITEEDSVLDRYAVSKGMVRFHIPKNIGGRYSIFTPVGLYVAHFIDMNISQLTLGTMNVNIESCIKYSLFRFYQYTQKQKKIECFATFYEEFEWLQKWVQQLFSESEGKENKGMFPIDILYSRDLHSVGQMLQEGERNICETFISIENIDNKLSIPTSTDDFDNLNRLINLNLESINKVVQDSTIMAHLKSGNVPIVDIKVERITEYNIGELLMFFMISCAISAYLLGVNPFNQTGVEEYKKNIKNLTKIY